VVCDLSSFLGFFLRCSSRYLHRGGEGGFWDDFGSPGGLVPGQFGDLGLVGWVLRVVAGLLFVGVRDLVGLSAVEGSDPSIQLEQTAVAVHPTEFNSQRIK
jgi:hypothetical protein